MSRDLCFVRPLLEAATAEDKAEAFSSAFETIIRLGRQPEFAEGYAQFLCFVAEARRVNERMTDAMIAEAVLDLAMRVHKKDSPDSEALATIIRSDVQRSQWYEEISKDLLNDDTEPAPLQLVVARDGIELQTIELVDLPQTFRIRRIRPGTYRVGLSTGLVVWEGRLTAQDLEWAKAYRDMPIQLAADTGECQSSPKLELRLLDGGIAIRVFPGIETGCMEIEVKG